MQQNSGNVSTNETDIYTSTQKQAQARDKAIAEKFQSMDYAPFQPKDDPRLVTKLASRDSGKPIAEKGKDTDAPFQSGPSY